MTEELRATSTGRIPVHAGGAHPVHIVAGRWPAGTVPVHRIHSAYYDSGSPYPREEEPKQDVGDRSGDGHCCPSGRAGHDGHPQHRPARCRHRDRGVRTMKFRVERDALADAVAWTARSLPARPAVPVLAGVLLEVDRQHADRLRLRLRGLHPGRGRGARRGRRPGAGHRPPAGRDQPRAAAAPGRPGGRRHPRSRSAAAARGSRCRLMPVEDYPTLPTMPTTAGVVDSDAFAAAVSQVAVAAGRDDTLPMLTGVRLEIEGDELTAGRHRPLPARGPRAALEAGAERAVRPGAHPGPDAVGRRRRRSPPARRSPWRWPAAAPARG